MSMNFGEDSERKGVTPDVKAKILEELKLELDSGVSPSYLLGCAEDFECVDELLQAEEAAYLVQYYTMLTEIRRLIRVDSKDQFASFLRTNRDLVLKYPATDVFMMLCFHSAVGCAAAFLEDPLIPLDVNSILECHMTPLHLAARNLSSAMTKLLLHHGADPHINVSYFNTPLDTALHAISDRCFGYRNDWNTQKSILHMLYLLCRPDLKEPLATVRLLSSHFTNLKDFCFQSIYDGYLQYYAPLLMINSDKLMVSSTEGNLKTTPVGQHIYQVLRNESLQQEMCEHTVIRLSKEMLVKNLTIAWDVVETLWIFIGVLDHWCHSRVENVPMYGLPFNITGDQLMKAVGSGDNIQCLLPKFTSEAKVLPKRNFFGKQGRPFSSLRSLTRNHMPVIGTSTFPSSSYVQHRSFHLYEAIQVKPSSCTLIALSRACASLMRSAKKIIK